jgi:hypothetical protein
MMKYALAAALTVATLAAPMAAQARTFYCTARSPTGSYGYGYSPLLGTARAIALRECAVRTPRNRVCVLTSCR